MTDISIVAPIVALLKTMAGRADKIRTEYIAATKPEKATKFADLIAANPEHAAVVAYTSKSTAVEAKIKELNDRLKAMRSEVTVAITGENTSEVSDDETKAMREEFLALQKKIKNTRDNVRMLLDGNDEDTSKALEGITFHTNLGGGSSPKSADSETVRLRLAWATVDGENVADSNGKVTFTTLSSKVGVSADVLREALAKSQGHDSITALRDFAKDTTFTFNVYNGDKVSEISVHTQPLPGGKKTETTLVDIPVEIPVVIEAKNETEAK